jgi:hypothetical protein
MADNKLPERPSPQAAITNRLPGADPFTPKSKAVVGGDPVSKFMKDFPAGTLPDEPEVVAREGGGTFVDDGPLPEGETPDSIAVKRQAALDAFAATGDQPTAEPAVTPEAGAAPAATASEGTPSGEPAAAAPKAGTPEPAAPVAPAAPAAAAPAAAAPGAPSYAPDEPIHLAAGVEPWTRAQIVAGLQERDQMLPAVQEATQFRKVFGQDAVTAEREWTPILDIMRREPERTKMLESILTMDEATLDYARICISFFNSPEGREQRGLPAQAPPSERAALAMPWTLQPPDKDRQTMDAMREFVVKERAKSEWETVFAQYPYVRDNVAIKTALRDAALQLWAADTANGIDELKARGLPDAVKQLRVFLEAQGAVANAASRATAPPPTPAPNTPAPAVAVLPSSGPSITGSRAPVDPNKEWRGNPDDAVAAFIKDHPQ